MDTHLHDTESDPRTWQRPELHRVTTKTTAVATIPDNGTGSI